MSENNALQTIKRIGDAPADDTPLLCLAPRGLAIYPVRYAVVPDTPAFANIKLPGNMGNKVTDVELQHHKYVLRLLREGYIYIYYHDHPDNKKWDIYQVGADAQLDELSVKAFKQGERKVLVANQSHFFIDKPWEQSKVDFAFSEHPWSKDTLDTMEGNDSLRNRRMQTFLPDVWVNEPSFPHGLPLTEDNLKHVFEYSDEMDAYSELHPDAVICNKISDNEGKHRPEILKLCSSANHFYMRSDDVEPLVKQINLVPDSKRNQPMLLALWDSVGITRELGGFAMDAAGWVGQYQQQWEQELNAIQNIETIQQLLQQSAHATNTEKVEVDRESTLHHNLRPQLEREEKLILTRLRRVEQSYPGVSSAELAQGDADYKRDQAELQRIRSQKLANQQKENRGLRGIQNARVLNSWQKYQNKVDLGKINHFKACVDALEQNAEQLITQRISDQIIWLKSVRLQDAFVEYSEESLIDGLFFEDLIGDLLTGLGGCEIGVERLNRYVTECTVTDDNLLWRAIASNQVKGKAALDSSLAMVEANKETEINSNSFSIVQTAAELMDELTSINNDGLALANTLKKHVGIDIPTGGLDKVYTALGDKLLKPFINPFMDNVATFIAEGIFLARAGVNVKEANKFAKAELFALEEGLHAQKQGILYNKFDNPEWQQRSNRRRKRSYRKKFNKIENTLSKLLLDEQYRFERYRMSYTRIYSQLDDGTSTTRKRYQTWLGKHDAMEFRFGFLMGVFQTLATWQLYNAYRQNPTNKMLLGNLLIAGTSTAGIVAEMGTKIVKQNSRYYTGLKVGGAGLLAFGGLLSGVMDFGVGAREASKNNYLISATYYVKGTLNFLSAGFGLAAMVVSLNGALETRIGTKLAPYVSQRLATGFALRFGLMAFLMSIGIWFTIAAVGIELLILLISDGDDDFQDWLEQTPMAKLDKNDKRSEPLFSSLKSQTTALDETLEAVWGIKAPPKRVGRASSKNIPNFDDMRLMP